MGKVLKVHVSTGWAGGDHIDYWELPDDWDSLSKDEKKKFCDESAMEYLHECCEASAWVVDSEDD